MNVSSSDSTTSPRGRTALGHLGLAALGLLKLAVVVWGIRRGYELGDEGFFLLNLNEPASSPRFFEFYKLLLHLDEPARFDVLDARWLRIAAELSGSLALVAGVWAFARRHFFAPGAVAALDFFAFCAMGTLLSASSRGFSYNDVTNLCTYGAVGALFFAAASGPGGRSRAALSIAGFLSGFQLFVKFPSAFGVATLVAVALAGALGTWARRERFVLAGFYALGGLLAIGLFIASNGGVAPLVEKFVGASEVGSMAGYDPLAMVKRSVFLEVWTGVNLLVLVVGFGTAFAVLRGLVRTTTDRAFAGSLLLAGGAMAVSVQPLHAAFTSASLTALSALAFFLPAALAATWHRSATTRDLKQLAPLLLLLALPFVNYAGTNVPLVSRLPSHALPVFVVLALLACDLRARAARSASHAAVVAILAGVTTLVFVRHHVLEPYGIRSPLYEQVHADPGLPGVRVDLATQRFLSEVTSSLTEAGFQPGDPIVAMDYMPGLVFYLGGRSPGFPFYAFARTEMNCFNLNRAGLAEPPFLILGQSPSEAQRACIEAFDFPSDFRLIRTLRFPYEQVYGSFGGHGLSHVSLYAPRDRARE